MGTLIGITGPIGSGKSTFADCLADMEPSHAQYESWHVVSEIATAFNAALKAELAYETTDNDIDLTNQVLIWLPEAISEHLHHDVVWNQLAFTKHDTLTKPDLYKKLFIYLAAVKKKPALLDTPITAETKETFRPLLQWLGHYLVTSISKTIWYDEIVRRIQLRDATTSLVIVSGVRYPSDAEVIRAHGGYIVAIERPNASPHNSDSTEARRHEIKPDSRVVNNGSIEQLQAVAESLWNDTAAGKLATVYTAS
jgi:hypothetical protein